MRALSSLALAAVTALCVTTAAHAVPVSLTTNFNVWHGNNPNVGDSTDPTQQALPSNPLTSQTYIGFFTYTGPINFADMDQATDQMDNFIPGVGLPHVQMSAPPFDLTTLFEFTFVLPASLTGASITHDDGISLYDITTNSDNLIPGNSAPTPAVTTPLPPLVGGDNYELWYVAANGAPSILIFNAPAAVPEPASLALIGAGLGALGVMRRKRAR